jgi:hypothetical protein
MNVHVCVCVRACVSAFACMFDCLTMLTEKALAFVTLKTKKKCF